MFRRRGICFWIGIACVVAGVFIILALVRSLRQACGCCAVDGGITGARPA